MEEDHSLFYTCRECEGALFEMVNEGQYLLIMVNKECGIAFGTWGIREWDGFMHCLPHLGVVEHVKGLLGLGKKSELQSIQGEL